jgi:hypothetical protein
VSFLSADKGIEPFQLLCTTFSAIKRKILSA